MPRIRVAAVNDYEIVILGLAALLSQFEDRIEVADAIKIGEPITGGPVDVALYDTYGRRAPGVAAVRELSRQAGVRRVGVFSAPITDQLVEEARAAGATGVIAKSLTGSALVSALERVATGHTVIESGSPQAPLSQDDLRAWPGQDLGLTERESTVAVLLAQGMTNAEIAGSLYLSVNTIKTHVRRLLEKLGAPNRTKATAIILGDHSFRRA